MSFIWGKLAAAVAIILEPRGVNPPPQQQYTPQGTTAEANEAYTPFGGARPSCSSSDEAEGEEEVFVDAEEEARGEFFVLS